MTSRKSKRSRHDERVSGSRDSRKSEIERKEEAFDASSYVDAHFVYGIFYSKVFKSFLRREKMFQKC